MAQQVLPPAMGRRRKPAPWSSARVALDGICPLHAPCNCPDTECDSSTFFVVYFISVGGPQVLDDRPEPLCSPSLAVMEFHRKSSGYLPERFLMWGICVRLMIVSGS